MQVEEVVMLSGVLLVVGMALPAASGSRSSKNVSSHIYPSGGSSGSATGSWCGFTGHC